MRVLVAVSVAFLVGVFALSGLSGLADYHRATDIWQVARLIETGASPPAELLDRLASGPVLEKALQTCRDDLSRAAVTLRLKQLENGLTLVRQAEEQKKADKQKLAPDREGVRAPSNTVSPDLMTSLTRLSRKDSLDVAASIRPDVPDLAVLVAMARRADEALIARLSCAPTDGNSWLRHAIMLSLTGAEPHHIEAALRLSYWAAPSEKWIIEARSRFVGARIDAGETGLLTELGGDLWRIAAMFSEPEIAAFFTESGPRTRALMVPFILKEPERRRRAVVEAIDKRGVSFR